MTARKRDYKAEEARRNQLARERGFTTRAAERGAKRRRDYERVGYKSHAAYVQARRDAQERSERKSTNAITGFRRRLTAEQFKRREDVFTRKYNTHTDYIIELATLLHELDPERYAPYEGNEAFWNAY